MSEPQSPPGWYPDPNGTNQQRYFDGTTWTTNYAPAANVQPIYIPVAQTSNGLAIAALVLGIAACCLGLIPILGYFAFPLAAIGLLLGIIAISRGTKRGMAITGTGLSALGVALAIAGVVIVQNAFSDLDSSMDEIAGNSTDQILQDYLDVQMGRFVITTGDYTTETALPVTLRNIGSESASFSVQIEAVGSSGTRISDDTAFVQNLAPGQSISQELFKFVADTDLPQMRNATFRIVQVSKY